MCPGRVSSLRPVPHQVLLIPPTLDPGAQVGPVAEKKPQQHLSGRTRPGRVGGPYELSE